MSEYPSTSDLQRALDATIRGAVRTEPVTLGAYATDASIYRFQPLAVVEPLDQEDVVAAVQCCSRHHWPLLPRGGGTSLVGQSVGPAVIVDLSRHCTRVLELNVAERWVRVEPGLVRDELNRQLTPHRLHFAPDPATTSRANIGGMLANNSSGMRSLRYGMTSDHVLEVELALASGEVVTLGPVTADALSRPPTDRLHQLQQALHRIVTRERSEILAHYPRVPRRAGGYALDAFTGPLPWNLAKLIAGSEGTLGVILNAKLNLEPVPRHAGVCLAQFATLDGCLRSVASIVAHGTSAVELVDGIIVRQARTHPLTRHTCRLIEGDPEAVLVIEVRSDVAGEVASGLAAIRNELLTSGAAYAVHATHDPEEVAEIWLMRESALGLMSTVAGPRRPIPYIEDAAVPLEVLPDYVAEVLAVCARHQQPVSLFAHAGAGLLHIRPMHNLRDPADWKQLKQIQDEVFELVLKYKGAWSGEHGDGIIRGAYNRRYFGERLYQAFTEIKALFDPEGLLNPGKVINIPPRDQNLRVESRAKPVEVKTAFRWQEEGGVAAATERCTGIGACRQLKSGVMCPSYMATRDELHSTRGRANVLRLALAGEWGPDALGDDQVKAVFDLCLSCKGCQGECPNKVDVGKMKAELLFQYYKTNRRPLRMHLLARPDQLGRWQAGPQALLVNALLQARFTRRALAKWLGLAAERPLPTYARQRFSTWFQRRPSTHNRPCVVLFNDIYMEYHQPEIGQAAVQVLEAAGYHVELTPPLSSQRPALSLGWLDRAARHGVELYRRLAPYAEAGHPILVVEPSCASALRDDLLDLVTPADHAQQVASQIQLVDEFLADRLTRGTAQWPELRAPGTTVFYHPHCHQRAFDNGRSTISLLKRVEEVDLRISNAGCCGMAGSFGYEQEHYELSRKVAADRLLPALEACPADAITLANGFSCRHQIADLAQRRAQHPLQWLAGLMPPQDLG